MLTKTMMKVERDRTRIRRFLKTLKYMATSFRSSMGPRTIKAIWAERGSVVRKDAATKASASLHRLRTIARVIMARTDMGGDANKMASSPRATSAWRPPATKAPTTRKRPISIKSDAPCRRACNIFSRVRDDTSGPIEMPPVFAGFSIGSARSAVLREKRRSINSPMTTAIRYPAARRQPAMERSLL